jgi:amidase
VPLCEEALLRFADLGAQIAPIAPPFSREALWEAWVTLRHFSVASGLAPMMQDQTARGRIKPEAIWEIEQGLALSAAQVQAASVIRSDWFVTAARLFESYDAIAMPTAQVWPFSTDLTWPRKINGQEMDTYHRWMECVIPVSLLGLPAVAVPAGFGAEGLPMGLQLAGRFGADRTVLSLAQAYHAATDWPGRQPPPV